MVYHYFLYYDARHAAEEETDCLRHVDDEKYEEYTMERYACKAPQFGTIALIVSDGMVAGKAFDDYKSRCEVEQEIDVLKTVLDALASYIQNDDRLEGWMFINFIALHIYMIRRRLSDRGLAQKVSTRETIRILCRQLIVRLNDGWRIAEASGKDKAQLEVLGVPVT